MLNQVYKIVKDVPIPKMVKVRQTFDRVRVEDPAAELKKELSQNGAGVILLLPDIPIILPES